MTLYRRRIPSIQAVQFGDPSKLPAWCREALFKREDGMIVRSIMGDLPIEFGDWIVQLPQSALTVKTSKQFHREYEEAPTKRNQS